MSANATRLNLARFMMKMMKAVAVGALSLSTVGVATELDKPSLQLVISPARTSEKEAKPGSAKPTKPAMFERVKGASSTTRLPDTARLEARGGVFL